MSIVAYRIYCTDCNNEKVIRDADIEDHVWKVESKIHHEGLCPACNDLVKADEEYNRDDTNVPFEDLDDIGQTGADNLRDAGIETRQDVKDASDDQILDVAWVGDGGLKSIRQEVQ